MPRRIPADAEPERRDTRNPRDKDACLAEVAQALRTIQGDVIYIAVPEHARLHRIQTRVANLQRHWPELLPADLPTVEPA